jgi:hypothetical protein
VVIWYIFSLFGILYQEKSGKPGLAVSSPLATEETGAMGRVPPGHRVVVFLKKIKSAFSSLRILGTISALPDLLVLLYF